MGIIANLKGYYKTHLSRDKILCLNNNVKFGCTVLDAMCRLAKSWIDVKEITVKNCFYKSNFIRDGSLERTIVEINDTECGN